MIATGEAHGDHVCKEWIREYLSDDLKMIKIPMSCREGVFAAIAKNYDEDKKKFKMILMDIWKVCNSELSYTDLGNWL